MKQFEMYGEKLEVLAILYRINRPVRYLDLVERGDILLAAALELTRDNFVSGIKLNVEDNHESGSYYELTQKGITYFGKLMNIASMLS